jgi:hypothetical protein
MRQKYGDTPEAGRRTRVNYRAMKRRRFREQFECVPRVRADWAKEKLRGIQGVIRLQRGDGERVEIEIGARARWYEDLSGI